MRVRAGAPGLLAASLLLAFLVLTPTANAATLEGAGCFAGTLPGLSESCKPVAEEHFTEEVQLGGVNSMAVNYTGAGGVKKGTVYAATRGGGETRVAMYEPRPGGGLEFVERWEVRSAEGPYERCGPLLGLNGEGKAEKPCAPQASGPGEAPVGVDVDQETGYVYVYGGFQKPKAARTRSAPSKPTARR